MTRDEHIEGARHYLGGAESLIQTAEPEWVTAWATLGLLHAKLAELTPTELMTATTGKTDTEETS
jgi:hypothetical protein